MTIEQRCCTVVRAQCNGYCSMAVIYVVERRRCFATLSEASLGTPSSPNNWPIATADSTAAFDCLSLALICSDHPGNLRHSPASQADGYSTGDGDSSPRSPFTPTRPTTLSVISELDTIQSEYTEEPSSPHSPSPTSVALVRDIDDLLDASAPRAPRKLDHYYAAPTRSKSCCVIA